MKAFQNGARKSMQYRRKICDVKKEGKLMRKVLIVLLIVILAISLVFTGCKQSGTGTGNGQEAEQTASTADDSNLTPPGTFPIVKEKESFSILIPWRGNAPIEENWNTVDYEEKTNVHIDWWVVPSEGWDEKKAIVFASDDLPDAIASAPQGVNLTATEQMQYGSQGLIIPLNNYIEKYSYWFKQAMEKHPQMIDIVSSADGYLYSFPDINVCYHCNYSQKMWVNHVWLKNLGLSMPTNTDEFYQMLKAFKERDPNGNNQDDERPLVTAVDSWQGQLDGFLMCAFTYTDGDTRLMVNDEKKIECVILDPKYKEGMKYLHMLYKEGLIAPESFTQNWQTMQKTNESGDRTVLGAIPAGANLFFAGGMAVSDRWKEYEILPPIEGPDGYKIAGNYTLTRNYTTGFFSITKAAKNPALIVRWIDWLYSEEGAIWSGQGREGIEWRKAEPGELDYNGNQAKYARLTKSDYADRYAGNIVWSDQFPRNNSKELREAWAVPQDYFSDHPLAQEVQLFQRTKLYEAVAIPVENTLPPLMVAADKVPEYTRLKTGIDDFIEESTAQFITGKKDIDKEWDSFINELYNLGLERYLELTQEAYDIKFKK